MTWSVMILLSVIALQLLAVIGLLAALTGEVQQMGLILRKHVGLP